MIQKPRGFTLIELLLVCVLTLMIAAGALGAFVNGVRLWGRSQNMLDDTYMSIFLDKFAYDLRSWVLMGGIEPKGLGQEISFPAIIHVMADGRSSRYYEENADQIGAVKYVYDPQVKKIMRSYAYYGQALKGMWEKETLALESVEGVSLRYYVLSNKGAHYRSQLDGGLPLGVEIDVQIGEGEKQRHFKRFVAIPVGGGL